MTTIKPNLKKALVVSIVYKALQFRKKNISYYTSMQETTALSLHRCLINTGVEKNEQHLNTD
jgi:hypothetical protein